MAHDLLARGRTADILAWEDGRVLKLFHPWVSPDWVRHEAEVARRVHAAGLPAPAPGPIVESGERLGLVYERVDGPSMLQVLARRPWTVPLSARLLARLHVQVHAVQVAEDVPSVRDRLAGRIDGADLPATLRDAALAALTRLPEGNRLCHGDFHPDNVLLAPRGPVIIDWPNAARGHPFADVARTILLLRDSAIPPGAPLPLRLLALARRLYARVYLAHYLRLFRQPPDARGAVRSWLPVIAAARLREAIPGERARLLALITRGIREPG